MSTVHSAHYMARHIKVLVLHGWGQDGTMGQRALHHLTIHQQLIVFEVDFEPFFFINIPYVENQNLMHEATA